MDFWRTSLILLIIALCRVNGSKIGSNIGECKRQRVASIEDVSDLSIFYRIADNTTITDMVPHPWRAPGEALRLPFMGNPCACSNLMCGCCAGIRITQFNIDRQICANISYDPFLFAIILDVSVNKVSIFNQVFSAKNPPAACIPIPLGTLPVPSGIDFCIKLFDIYTPGVRNLHVCMNWEFRMFSTPILVLQFDCLKIGYDGIAIVKPDAAGAGAGDVSNAESVSSSGDIYDEVTEMKVETTELTDITTDLTTTTDINNLALESETTTNAP